jgi:hypothetical protein
MATGQDVWVQWTPDGESAIVITTQKYVSFSPGNEMDSVEVSGGGDAVRVYEETLMTIEPSLTVRLRSDNADLRDALKQGQLGVLEWGMEGNAAGRPHWGITCKVFKSTIDAEYDGELDLEVEFKPTSGTLVYDGRTAVFS